MKKAIHLGKEFLKGIKAGYMYPSGLREYLTWQKLKKNGVFDHGVVIGQVMNKVMWVIQRMS